MSQAHIEQFYKKVVADPALFQNLVDGAETPEQFIQRAVAAAQSDGLQVDVAEATAWIEGQMQARASGELSDAQLEAVAGGKTLSAVTRSINPIQSFPAGGTPSPGGTPSSGGFNGSLMQNLPQCLSSGVAPWFKQW